MPYWEVCSEASAQVQYHRHLEWNQISGFKFCPFQDMMPHMSSATATQKVLGTQCSNRALDLGLRWSCGCLGALEVRIQHLVYWMARRPYACLTRLGQHTGVELEQITEASLAWGF